MSETPTQQPNVLPQSAPDAGEVMTAEQANKLAQEEAAKAADISQMHQSTPDAGEVMTQEEANALAAQQNAPAQIAPSNPTPAPAAATPTQEEAKPTSTD
jgi:hypothetical protein